MRILLVEDHKRLAKSIIDGLAGFGFGVDAFAAAGDGLAAKKHVAYDAIILDLGLPDRDGIDLLSEIRIADKVTPVLILTARDGVDERVAGLDRGADDYVLKPFAMKELAARLRALLRRPGRALGTVLEVGNLAFDTSAREVKVNGKTITISQREIVALELMMRRSGGVVSKASLEDALYGLARDVNPNAVEAVVSRLRKRLQQAGADCTVHALRGIGYLLKEK
ncbi:response regulator transcription factor [Rhodoplanes sp. Z2-YC6860]|uniref:response regulator transcription factor n=1 Tax=Rhodoplanes sp. Z2-YC6860 TaxID=674703 RepID=UPI00078BF3BC|nr:response regulator transcription factor [Rhodoplanes sp. Z2-YC6860]AMN38494.1 DNA-binding two-component response regulator [Rhodoplanes sp. Z2-YC6860]